MAKLTFLAVSLILIAGGWKPDWAGIYNMIFEVLLHFFMLCELTAMREVGIALTIGNFVVYDLVLNIKVFYKEINFMCRISIFLNEPRKRESNYVNARL
jgi:hypothetical protein